MKIAEYIATGDWDFELLRKWLSVQRGMQAKMGLFARDTPEHRRRLQYEMKRFADHEISIEGYALPDVVVKAPEESGDAAARAAYISTFEAAWKAPYAEARSLHSRLSVLDDDTERRDHAERITSLMLAVRGVWEELRRVKSGGAITDAPRTDLPAMDQREIRQKIKNLRSNISKHKDNPEKAVKVLGWAQELEALYAIQSA